MKTTLTAIAIIVLGISLVLSSCEKEPLIYDSGQGHFESKPILKTYNTDFVDTARYIFAKALSLALADEDIRDFIDDEVISATNPCNDFEFLFELVKMSEIRNDSTFAQIMATYSDVSLDYFTDTIGHYDPKLTVYVYYPDEDSTSWNTTSYIPEVAFLSYDFEDSASATVPYFDQGSLNVGDQGFDLDDEPTDVRLVVKESEFFSAVDPANEESWEGEDLKDFVEAYTRETYSNLWDYYTILDYATYKSGYSYEYGSAHGGTAGCDRTNSSDKENLYQAGFYNNQAKSNACPWIEGKIELFAYPIYNTGLTSSGNVYPEFFAYLRKRKEFRCPGGTCRWMDSPDFTTIEWDEGDHGDVWKYYWIERDKTGWSFELGIPLSTTIEVGSLEVSIGLNAKIKYDPIDEQLGGKTVEYCDDADDPGETYTNGAVRFKVRTEP